MTALLKQRPDAPERLYRPRVEGGSSGGGLKELDVVVLRVNTETFDGEAVVAGTVGTIVTMFENGAAFDVEFSRPAGIASVSANEIAPHQ